MATKKVTVQWDGDPSGFTRSLTTIEEKSAAASNNVSGHFERATSKIGGLFRGLDAQLGAFGIPFTGALSTIGDKIDGMAGKAEGIGSKLLAIGGGAAIGIGAAAVAIGVESIHLADSFEIVNARLETAITNAGGNFKQLDPQIQSSYDKMATFGYNATETAGALTTLVGLTRDPQKAIRLLGDTANFAAQYNKDLATSAQAVGLAAEGQMGRLKRLVGDLGITAGGTTQVTKAQDALTKANENAALVEAKVADGRIKSKDAAQALGTAYGKVLAAQEHLNQAHAAGGNILHALSERDMGAAERRSKTFAGEMKGLTAELENVGIKIGLWLIPYVKKFTEGLQEAVAWVNAHRSDFKRFFDDVSNAVQTMWRVVEPIYTAIWNQLAAVFGLVDDLVNGNWSAIWGDVVNIVKAAVGFLIAPAIGLYHLFQSTFDDIGSTIAGIWNGIWAMVSDVLGGAIGAIGGALNFLSGIWSSIWNGISDVANWVGGAVSAFLQPIIDTISTIIGVAHDAAQAVSDIGSFVTGSSGSIGDVTNAKARAALKQLGYGAEGAIVNGPTLAMIGEAGPEAVVPLNRMPGASPLSAGIDRGDGKPVHVHLHLDGKQIHEVLLKRKRQTGDLRLV